MNQQDDKLFAAKIKDLFEIAYSKSIVRFSSFLDDESQFKAKEIGRSYPLSTMLFGGYPQAERKILGVFPDYAQPEESVFPIRAVTAVYSQAVKLTHRDFLGALMNLGIKRESVGDIVVGEGKTVFLLCEPVLAFVLSEFKRVGRAAVELYDDQPDVIERTQEFEQISGSVASLRLDCVLSLALKCPRESSSCIIKSGDVSVNYSSRLQRSFVMKENDIFTVRGYGKFILSSVDGNTRKNRLRITIKKYK